MRRTTILMFCLGLTMGAAATAHAGGTAKRSAPNWFQRNVLRMKATSPIAKTIEPIRAEQRSTNKSTVVITPAMKHEIDAIAQLRVGDEGYSVGAKTMLMRASTKVLKEAFLGLTIEHSLGELSGNVQHVVRTAVSRLANTADRVTHEAPKEVHAADMFADAGRAYGTLAEVTSKYDAAQASAFAKKAQRAFLNAAELHARKGTLVEKQYDHRGLFQQAIAIAEAHGIEVDNEKMAQIERLNLLAGGIAERPK